MTPARIAIAAPGTAPAAQFTPRRKVLHMGDTQARRAWLNRYRQAIKQENALCARIEKAAAATVEWREQLALQVVKGVAIRREIEQAIERLPDAMQVCV